MSRSTSVKPDRAENRLTVILIRGLGGLRTYNLSMVWFRLAGAMLICLALAVAALGYQNYTLRQDRQRLVSQLFLDEPVKAKPEALKKGPGVKEGRLAGGLEKTTPQPSAEQASRAEKAEEAAARPESKKSTPAPAAQTQSPAASAKDPAPAPAASVTAAPTAETGSDKRPPAKDETPVPEAAPPRSAEKADGKDPATKPENKIETENGSQPTAAADKSAEEPETDAAKLAAAVAENLAEDRLSAEQMELDSIKTMRLAQPKGIKISYKIKNLIGEGRRISGYAFMVGLSQNKEPVKAFPAEAVFNEGRPVNFKQGRYFSIRQYTTIRGRIYTDDQISFMKIMVYDLSGQLVMTRQIEADDV